MPVKEQVKLEAAKVRFKYTEQEQELTRQKAALDADLEKLVREREVDEAESKEPASHQNMSDSEWTSDKSLRRQRNFTEKAQEAYQVIVQKYWTTLTGVKQEIHLLIEAMREGTCTVSDVDTHVRQKLELYRRNSEGFLRYLSSIRTRFSDIETENNDQELKNIEKEIQFYLNRVDEHPGTSKQDSLSEQNITVIQKEQDSEDLLTDVQLKSEHKSDHPVNMKSNSKAKSIRSKLSGK
ncbi:unnamed protein product [Mytilus coruscus]|uniref:Uncharacterized protein n=1 Tax=Mytilus coruscus TaxID=42192 RepID=A0A6J8F099_MYTCO|nr:unnamed protein product [Mytilus coruscus]